MTNWKNTSSDAQGPPPDDEALRKRLNELVQTRNVRTAFQPIVDLHDGSIAGYEALTRPGAESGYAGPAELFEDAASFDMLWALEELTRRSSIESAGSWPENVRLFLNCTPDVIADARFQEEIQSLMRPPSKIKPQQVVLEVTELSEEQHVEGLYEQVTALKKLGVELAIDDVGAGTSGLNRIMLLRPQWLKLDREFIRSIDTDLF